jgi:hypothetical protein
MFAMYLLLAPLVVGTLSFFYIKKRRARRAGSAH